MRQCHLNNTHFYYYLLLLRVPLASWVKIFDPTNCMHYCSKIETNEMKMKQLCIKEYDSGDDDDDDDNVNNIGGH